MRRQRIPLTALAASAMVLLLLGACTTTDHRVTIEPPQTEKPVSASGSYVTADGRLVTPSGYRIVDHVAFTKVDTAPVAETTKNTMTIDSELEEVFTEYDADALVNLKVYAENYDPGNTSAVGANKIMGSMFLGFGLPFLIIGAADPMLGDIFIPMGAVFSGVGGVQLGLAFVLPGMSESVWTIGFEGDAVREAGAR
jgi:hypothetical protein